MELSEVEARVLGALVEKSLATPQQYPLSEQALLSACNQSSNREPVTDYGIADLRRALIGLRAAGLAREIHQPGARVEKHRHSADETLGLDEGALAVLALLLLRGPQTAGELRSRCSRLHGYATVAEVAAVLDDLAARQPPLVARLERRPGQKEARWTELLAAEEDRPAGGDEPRRAEASAAGPEGGPGAAPAGRPDPDGQIAALRVELGELRARVAALERALEQR